MKPVVKNRLLEKFPERAELFNDFVAVSCRVKRRSNMRAKAKSVDLSTSSVDRKRRAILKRLKNAKNQKDIDRAYKSFLNCPPLIEHVSRCRMEYMPTDRDQSWIDIMSIPLDGGADTQLATPAWAVIALCIRHDILIKEGNRDFIEICYLMLRELDSDRASYNDRKRAFRRDIISRYKTTLAGGNPGPRWHTATIRHPPHPPPLDLINCPISSIPNRPGTENLDELVKIIERANDNGTSAT